MKIYSILEDNISLKNSRLIAVGQNYKGFISAMRVLTGYSERYIKGMCPKSGFAAIEIKKKGTRGAISYTVQQWRVG